MPINAHPDYIAAEGEYLKAQTIEQKIECLKKMISLAPSHKGAENLRAQLKIRLKKLLEKQDKEKKSGKSTQKGIKKEDMQAVLVGPTNSGKSSILSTLTNANTKISELKFSTTTPTVGMMPFSGTGVQLIEIPATDSEYYNKSVVHTADTILIVVNKIDQIETTLEIVKKDPGEKIIIFNPKEDENLRKIEATLKSKKYNFIIVDLNSKENIKELKEKIFLSFKKLRVFTKEPGKEKSERPVIMKPNSTVKDVAERILKGFSNKIKETRIWGPSSKFPGQIIGLKHKLKDLDVVEFKTN